MNKDKQFDNFWAWLGTLGFRQKEKIGGLFKDIYSLEKESKDRVQKAHLRLIRDWLLVPYSFWPIDFSGLGTYMCKVIRAGENYDTRLGTVFTFLTKFPAKIAQLIVIDHENSVRKGEYGQFIFANAKFDAFEQQTVKNPLLLAQWEQLTREYDMTRFLDEKGIVRRTMVCERNFKGADWEITGFDTEEERFRIAFDAFCTHWHLYGMEKGRPLLLKISVNVTPHGVLIMIPTYWNPDFKRDINWTAISKLIKANGTMRLGTKLAQGQSEKREQARLTHDAAQLADTQQLTGEERNEFITKKAGLSPLTEDREIRRLIALHKKVLTGASIATPKRRWKRSKYADNLVIPPKPNEGTVTPL